MDKLKPCPFCGKPVCMIYNSLDNAFKFYHKNGMDDLNCCAIEPIMLKGHSLADAAKLWNRRAADTKEIDFDYEAEDGR